MTTFGLNSKQRRLEWPRSGVGPAANDVEAVAPPSSVMLYVVQAQVGTAVKRLRASLEASRLTVLCDLDVTESIRSALGVELAPCRILSVACPLLLLQAAVSDPARLAVFVVRMVVIEKNHRTQISLPNTALLAPAADDDSISKLNELSARICDCLRQVCTRMRATL